jgi:ArsR family transcriptional regulator
MNDKKAPAVGRCHPAPAPTGGDAELARLCWALAHPARVAIVRLLTERDACICGEIVEELPLAQSTVSQHLKILKESGLVCGTLDGPRTCYCLDLKALRRLKQLVDGL